MADTTVYIGDAGPGTMIAMKAIDNGDGTYSLSTRLPSGVTIKETRASTATVTSVSDTASSTTLLAANSNRLGFRMYNNSSSVCYVKYGTTASATDFTIEMAAESYLEETQYTGRVDGIWSADASGAMLITELTA